METDPISSPDSELPDLQPAETQNQEPATEGEETMEEEQDESEGAETVPYLNLSVTDESSFYRLFDMPSRLDIRSTCSTSGSKSKRERNHSSEIIRNHHIKDKSKENIENVPAHENSQYCNSNEETDIIDEAPLSSYENTSKDCFSDPRQSIPLKRRNSLLNPKFFYESPQVFVT